MEAKSDAGVGLLSAALRMQVRGLLLLFLLSINVFIIINVFIYYSVNFIKFSEPVISQFKD